MKAQRKSESHQVLIEVLTGAENVAKTARRNGQGLGGAGFYAQKFADAHATATVALQNLSKRCSALAENKFTKQLDEISECIRVFFSTESSSANRNSAKKRCCFLLRTEIEPVVLGIKVHQASDKFFPMEIAVATGRNYIRRVAEQACGAYDLGWYDCAAIMARRLLETLIIEVYESKGIDSKLKKPDGTFHQLSGLVGVVLNETSFNISRNTKTSLPKLKDLGDQSAHNRRYTARQADIDGIKRDLRVTLEEFVHLAGFKKTKTGGVTSSQLTFAVPISFHHDGSVR
jgi:hypothetical protein